MDTPTNNAQVALATIYNIPSDIWTLLLKDSEICGRLLGTSHNIREKICIIAREYHWPIRLVDGVGLMDIKCYLPFLRKLEISIDVSRSKKLGRLKPLLDLVPHGVTDLRICGYFNIADVRLMPRTLTKLDMRIFQHKEYATCSPTQYKYLPTTLLELRMPFPSRLRSPLDLRNLTVLNTGQLLECTETHLQLLPDTLTQLHIAASICLRPIPTGHLPNLRSLHILQNAGARVTDFMGAAIPQSVTELSVKCVDDFYTRTSGGWEKSELSYCLPPGLQMLRLESGASSFCFDFEQVPLTLTDLHVHKVCDRTYRGFPFRDLPRGLKKLHTIDVTIISRDDGDATCDFENTPQLEHLRMELAEIFWPMGDTDDDISKAQKIVNRFVNNLPLSLLSFSTDEDEVLATVMHMRPEIASSKSRKASAHDLSDPSVDVKEALINRSKIPTYSVWRP